MNRDDYYLAQYTDSQHLLHYRHTKTPSWGTEYVEQLAYRVGGIIPEIAWYTINHYRSCGYFNLDNTIVIFAGRSRRETKDTLIHELVHSWGFLPHNCDFWTKCHRMYLLSDLKLSRIERSASRVLRPCSCLGPNCRGKHQPW